MYPEGETACTIEKVTKWHVDCVFTGKRGQDELLPSLYDAACRLPAVRPASEMSVYHDEVEIEDFEYDEEEEMYYYPCPCGDRFQISREELIAGEEVATCPSCSLIVKVIYDPEAFAAEQDETEAVAGKATDQLEKN